MNRLKDVCSRLNIEAKGIIHIGGTGEELELYEKMGFKRILFVQPNPRKFKILQDRIVGLTHVLGVMVDVGAQNGYVADGDRPVARRRLEYLLIELGVPLRALNVLVVSDMQRTQWIQIAFGMKHLMDRLDVVYSPGEVIADRDFPDDMVPDRNDIVHRKPVINLWQEPKHGRFGNELFHYFMATLISRQQGCRLHTAPWLGSSLFQLNDPLLMNPLPVIQEHTQQHEKSAIFATLRGKPHPTPLQNVCIASHFQFFTGIYTADERETFRRLFQPAPALEKCLQAAKEVMMGASYKTLVAIHIRRGDYTDNHPTFGYRTPVESYKKWLREVMPLLDNPLLYVASDDPSIAAEFNEFPRRAMNVPIAEQFYVDFWTLTQADALAISNSSFSFAAAMLNRELLRPAHSIPHTALMDPFVRPLKDGSMVAFDPWNDDVLRHRYDAPEFPSSEQACMELLIGLLPGIDPLHGGVVVEVGLGSFAWYFAAFEAMGFACVAVEPFPVVALKEAIGKGWHKGTRFVFDTVVAGVDGKIKIYPGRLADLHSLREDWWGRDLSRPAVTIRSTRLDTLLADVQGVTLLKLDVEGSELEIIEQFAALKECQLPEVVMFEYATMPPDDKGSLRDRSPLQRAVDALKILRGLGYRTGWMVENHAPATPIDLMTLPLPLGPEAVFPSDCDYGNLIVCRPPRPTLTAGMGIIPG